MDFEPFNHLDVPVFCVKKTAAEGYTYVFANASHAFCTGLSSAELTGHPLDETLSPTLKDQLTGLFDQITPSSTSFREMAELDLPKGRFSFDINLRLLPGEQPCILGTAIPVAHIAQDGSDADLSSQDAEKFVALAAHDLRTPMRNVQSITDMLLDNFEDRRDGKLELIQMLSRLCRKTGLLGEEILDYVAAGQTGTEPGRVDFAALCADLVKTLDTTERSTVIATPITVETDPGALRIILRNLMSAAISHMEGIGVAFSLRLEPRENGQMALLYRDTTKNFAGFESLVSDDLAARWNSGFGLAAVRRLVLAQNGAIKVTPSEGNRSARLELLIKAREIAADS